MVFIVYSLLFILFVVAILFSFPRFSPIPYFPSNKKDLPLIIESLKLKNDQIVIDLGAGDGIIIFEAAKKAYEEKLNTKFIAVDINPILLLIMHIRRLFHQNKKNIKIKYDNIFTMNFNSLTRKPVYPESNRRINSLTFYLYISPWYLEKVILNLKLLVLSKVEGKIKNFSVVSYMYPIKSFKQKEKLIKGFCHDIYTYMA